MPSSVRRTASFAAVGTLALAAPPAGALAAVPFALIAVVGRLVSDGPLFELLASPADEVAGQLRGLVSFSLAVTGLALLASLTGLSATAFVVAVLVLVYGDLAVAAVGERVSSPLGNVVVFGVGGSAAAVVGLLAVEAATEATVDPTALAFLAVTAAIVISLFQELLIAPDDPVVLVSATGLLWVLASLGLRVDLAGFALALAVASGFGYLSWRLETASLTGMLTGVAISLGTIVLGGLDWFAILIAFFGLGGLVAKFRYETKVEYGVAETNRGARTIRNVLGNTAVAVAAVIGFAASPGLGVEPLLFAFVFAGSLAAAMSDTLSSEIGVLFGEPRLITTLESVDTGTDGGITLEGVLAGVAGGLIVAVLALGVLSGVTPAGALVIAAAGVIGMFADSVLGATLEGWLIGNQSVNFLSTLVGGLLAPAGAIVVGAIPV
ncbi:MAG: DUF92 domain-containing protein [Halobacteriales archaeon]|nr:DUF92 domain-containing protein [Halobacteriales archaeon]